MGHNTGEGADFFAGLGSVAGNFPAESLGRTGVEITGHSRLAHGGDHAASQSAAAAVRLRKTAAIFSRETASARTPGCRPAFFRAAESRRESKRDFRLLARVLRFWPKESLRKAMNSSSGTRNLSI